MFVSHDQALIQGMAKELWEVTGGKLVKLSGDFADYKARAVEALRGKQ